MGLSGMAGPWLFALSFAYAVDPAKGLNMPGVPFYAASFLMVLGVAAALGRARRRQDCRSRGGIARNGRLFAQSADQEARLQGWLSRAASGGAGWAGGNQRFSWICLD